MIKELEFYTLVKNELFAVYSIEFPDRIEFLLYINILNLIIEEQEKAKEKGEEIKYILLGNDFKDEVVKELEQKMDIKDFSKIDFNLFDINFDFLGININIIHFPLGNKIYFYHKFEILGGKVK